MTGQDSPRDEQVTYLGSNKTSSDATDWVLNRILLLLLVQGGSFQEVGLFGIPRDTERR